MLTKYILHINKESYELTNNDLKNWAEIQCSIKRADFDGLTRTFTSQFEFVNEAFEIIRTAYIKDRYNVNAILEVFTINDRWTFDKRFECPLDFSTIEWEGQVLRINAVDNDLSAKIKSNKGTKYEFVIGEEIATAGKMLFERLQMTESVTYGFTQGESIENSADLIVTFKKGERPYLGCKGDEVAINGLIYWNDDQTTEDESYMLRAYGDVDVRASYKLAYDSRMTYGHSVDFLMRVIRDGKILPITQAGCRLGSVKSLGLHNFGTFERTEDLPDISEPIIENGTDLRYSGYAVVDGIIWECSYLPWTFVWKSSGKTEDEFYCKSYEGSGEFHLQSGDLAFIEADLSNVASNSQMVVRFKESTFNIEWKAIDKPCEIDILRPDEVGRSLLQRIVGNSLCMHIDISDFDKRISNTYIVAGESIRAIDNAKFYSSFTEFCDWMSTVFGYIYYVGEPTEPRYKRKLRFGSVIGTPYPTIGHFNGKVEVDKILYNSYKHQFFYGGGNGKYYDTWEGSSDYNNKETGCPFEDVVYYNESGEGFIFEKLEGQQLYPTKFNGDESVVGKTEQTVYFLHRTELMRADGFVRPIEECRDLKYSVDQNTIYADVTIGYDKKDYDGTNGRDEFNFNNTYATGCTVTDKTLTLLSKYRADSYGMEFLAQKRNAESTDNESDNNTFFVLLKERDGQMVVDKSSKIEGTMSDTVFNGAFCPMACVKANAGIIGLQAPSVNLKFTSSTGNSDIVIDGVKMSDDLTVSSPLATSGVVEFSTNEVDVEVDVNEIIEVAEDGILYRGYIKEVDINFARAEAAKYKLIVKDIEL